MPITDQIRDAIDKAPLHLLPEVTQTLWKAVTAGAVTWDAAETLSALIEVRRGILAARGAGTPRSSSARRSTRSISEAWSRRRRLAASGPLPPGLAAAFTTGELAALRIVLDEVRDRGACDRTLGELAARAGVSIDTARRAIRQASRMGLITVEERRRHRQPSLSNLIRVVSPEVQAWIDHHRYQAFRGGGWQDCHAKEIKSSKRPWIAGESPANHPVKPPQRSFGLPRGASEPPPSGSSKRRA